MKIVTELMDPRDIVLLYKYADIIQIGTRNMQNFRLLTEVGNIDKPVILKRGLCATIKEFLMSAEYIMAQGNEKVILCETGNPHLRNRDPQYARYQRRAAFEETHAPSGDRRPQPRGGQGGPRARGIEGGRGRRGRRAHGRSARASRRRQ